ncbi:MAG: ROK family protein, partial [Clostridia bacterium]|nr:ROK family protein [Clostridia bacterium]
DLGGTKCAVLLGDETSAVLGKRVFPTGLDTPPEPLLKQMETEISALLAEKGLRASDIQALGVSCGGPLDSGRGVILSPPNLPLWDGVEITRYFETRFAIPSFLQNDANACALAEWRFGAGRGCRNMVFLTFGTGMGAGIIVGGMLLDGANGNAGEIGHVRLTPRGPVGYGKPGSFEGYCSGGGLARLAEIRARERGLPRTEYTAKELARLAQEGDAFALSLWAECGSMLGRGLAILVDVLNPERIVIGSIFARCEPLLRGAMERAMNEEALSSSLSVCRVVPAQLGEAIGDIASLSVAIQGKSA